MTVSHRMTHSTESPLSIALRRFEEAEANLNKIERLWGKARDLIPSGIVFGDNPDYEDACRSIESIATHLPGIDGWRPNIIMMDLNVIAQTRLDYAEIGEPEASISFELSIDDPAKELRQYRFRFNQKRRELVRERVFELETLIDALLPKIDVEISNKQDVNAPIAYETWELLKQHVDEIDALLGSSVKRPRRWRDLRRHIGFGQVGDFLDICKHDWPAIKDGLHSHLYGDDEPIPVGVDDLSDIVSARPKGPVAIKLLWSNLTDDDFERLIFALISSAEGYENPEWLMHTNAPDQGRDLSVLRVYNDHLSGIRRSRVMIQCKHWLTKSVAVADVATLKEQIRLWTQPRFDVLVIATSGRFSSDAVRSIETHNETDTALKIEMWPESHLERLLAAMPGLIAEFQLR